MRRIQQEKYGAPKPVIPLSTVGYTVARRKRQLRKIFATQRALEKVIEEMEE